MARIALHPITLRFGTEELELGFAESSTRETVPLARASLILGCALYAAFGVLDRWMVPEAVTPIWGIRAGVCALMTIALALTFRPRLRPHLRIVLGIVVLATGLGIVGMVAAAEAEGGYFYYAGLMLVLAFSHGAFRLRFVPVSTLTATVIAAYLGVAWASSTPSFIILNNMFFLVAAQIVCMFISYALEYYRRQVFWQKRILGEQQRRLRQEDERKTRELQEIRALQLGMLPRRPPNHRDLAIAVHMRTASEVGGDFYDFHVAEDGTLTCAVGDATGHGAKAGAVVTAMKMLFTCLAAEADVQEVLRKAAATFRESGPRISMALALLRFRGRVLELAGAGMPPAIVYHAGTNRVSELPLNGMPVGCMADFPYEKRAIDLEPGDTILLTSDGFPELLNEEDEVLGYERRARLFATAAARRPSEVIDHLVRAAEDWAGACELHDDVTLVVLKVKPQSPGGHEVVGV